MVEALLGQARLVAQGLVDRPFASPAHVVAAFGAMQGQDLPGVIASVALRTQGGDVADVVAAMDAGELVRGYPMRGTVFLMSASDVVWVSELCNAAQVRAQQKRRGQLGLTDAHVALADELAAEHLAAHPTGLSRADLFGVWQAAGIPVAAGCGYHLLSHLIQLGRVCYGPWNGTDQNVVVTASWAPQALGLEARFNGDRVAAVADLLERYLLSHGPATVRDFAWWTKLPLREIGAALPLVLDRLAVWAEPGRDDRYHRPGLREELGAAARASLLLPGFDEFILGYADRLFALTPEQHQLLVPGNNGVFGRSAVAGGVVRALWKRGGRPGRRSLELRPFEPLSDAQRRRFEKRYEAFPFVGE